MSVPEKGTMLHGFEVLSVNELAEYRSTGILLRHRKTGCEVYHLSNDDEENLFAFAFKTLPHDNTGVPHILEHSVLCGSKRFPVKDPFLFLMKSSMNTFLNAFTFPDKTVYPASSTVEKDYFNLMKVYGDAVFFPLLKEEVFRQEGHRFEFTEDGGLEITGIVYNEMKGNYSNPDSIVAEWSYRSLFPNSPYRYDSGGEPEEIPSLTYRDFLDFHRRYYHPSNCKVYLYGNIEIERQLEFLDREFLGSFPEGGNFVPKIELQKRIDRPIFLEKTYPVREGEPTDRKTSITVNWLLAPVTDSLLLLSFEVLAEMLLGNAGSPLQKALVESGLGEDVSPASGIETELKELVFTAGLRGTDPDKRQAIEELIIDELRRLVREGIPADVKEAALRKVEFRNREIRGGGGPFGLRLMRKVLRGWLHDSSPEMTLEFSRWMEILRTRNRDYPNYFENLIKTYLAENSHRSTVVVRPDPQLQRKEDERLKRSFAKKLASMPEQEREAIRKKNEMLRQFQEEQEPEAARKTIPVLTLADVPRAVEIIPHRRIEIEGAETYLHELYTNDIVYLNLVFELEGLGKADLELLPFLSDAVTGLGLPGMPYDEVARRIDLVMGGFGAYLDVSPTVQEPDRIRKFLLVRMKALEETLPEALDLAGRLFLEADFTDTDRLKDLFLEARNDVKSSVIPHGHSYAALRAQSRLSRSHRIEELWKGVSQVQYLAGFSPERDVPELGRMCEALRSRLFTRDRLRLGLTCSADAVERVVPMIGRLLGRLPERPGDGAGVPFSEYDPDGADPRYEALVAPSTVNFVATAVPASRIDTPEYAAEALLAHYLSTGFLWERIRMKGGAYGAFAWSAGMEGVFSFASYRDPNILETLEAFGDSLEAIVKEGIPRTTVEHAILGSIGGELRPLSPAEKGAVSLKRILYGVTDELRQRKRNLTLEMTGDRLVEAARRLSAAFDRARSAVLCGKDALEAASGKLPELSAAVVELPD
jgi:Zn-dependent M16 (insulinase) family peptidase